MAPIPSVRRHRRATVICNMVAALVTALSLGGVPAAHATCGTDTVVVYGPAQFSGIGVGSWQGVLDEFSTSTSWGRRYLVEVVNGNTRVNGLIVSVDGQQWIGSSQCGTGVASITRVIDGVADGSQGHDVEVQVNGSSSAYVTLRICHVSDPTFTVSGPSTHTWTTVPATGVDPFRWTHEDCRSPTTRGAGVSPSRPACRR